MKRIKRIKHKVAALCLSLFLALELIAPAFSIVANAEALPEILESSATIADCVMTYYAMSGSAVSNTEWINTLYNSLGSSFGTIGGFAEQGLMTYVDGVWQPAEQLTQNIANTAAYTDLGLDAVFNVSASEVAAGGGLTVATGAATLSGAAGCVATYGILPVLGGVTAAYWGGIAVGTLVNHLIDKYSGNIELSAPIDYPVTSELLDKRFEGGNVGSYMAANTVYFIFVPNDIVLGGYSSSPTGIYGYGYTNPTGQRSFYRSSAGDGLYELAIGHGMFISGKRTHETYAWPNMFESQGDYYSFRDGVLNGTVIPESFQNYSPDIIGPNGNQQSEYDSETGQYVLPDMNPQIDPQTQSGKPLSLNDWLNFANSVQDNNTGADPITDNSTLFENLLDALRIVIPEVDPNPDPDPDPDPNPDPDPDPNPYPDLNPDPETVPVNVPSISPYPNTYPVPDPESVPDNREQPEYTEKQTENETDILEGDPYTTPNLLNKFPFCIPRDILRAFKKLDSGSREAPHIQWRFHPNEMIDYTFDIDFAVWENIATLLRILELIAFVIALGIATRNLILS